MPDGDVFPCHALTQPEFRCGNVRERSLIEICDRRGVLGRLSTLDFISLASEEGRIEEITRPCACLGHVYTSTAQLAVWRRRVLPAAD